MEEIIGREKEKVILERVLNSSSASFLAIYGRRRIGKTHLIRNYFKIQGLFFHLTGIQDASMEVQLRNFSAEFSDHFRKGKKVEIPKDWFEAFQILRKEIELVPSEERVILFLDELPWLSAPRSNMIQALDHFWNRYLSGMSNVTLIVCGSAASWMLDNVINSKGGLHGRMTHSIRLLPFTLLETEQFLLAKGIQFDRKQLIELYMCIGGVAKYLTYFEKGKSVTQIIGELCFSYDAPLLSEFHKLYRSLFSDHIYHLKLVKALSIKRSGLEYQELSREAEIPSGGTLTKKLEELIESGFVTKVSSFDTKKKSNRYVLTDEYSLFYLTWISGVSALDIQSRGAEYWLKQSNTPTWRSWTGYAYENLCLKHIDRIKDVLGLRAVQTTTSKWQQPASTDSLGAEIDLVIDRADKCINICEIKFYSDTFTITKDYAEKLKNKKRVFEESTKTKKSVFTTLITTYGAQHNQHFDALIDQELDMNALF